MSFIPEQKGFFGRVAESVSRAFVPPKDPKEAVQQWTRQIRSEGRSVDRSVREIEREKKKAERQIKQHAKEGNIASAKVIAREVVNSNKAISRLHTQKAHMMDMEMALKHQLAMVKLAGTINKSTEVMKIVTDMVQVGSMQAGMREMAKEMMKAGLIEEIVNDVMEDVSDAQEEEVDEEVAKVLQEVAGDVIETLPDAGKTKVEPEKTEEEKAQEFELLQQLAAGEIPSTAVQEAV
eukprot:jgi/Ulvmu1/6218/UM028_0074.1